MICFKLLLWWAMRNGAKWMREEAVGGIMIIVKCEATAFCVSSCCWWRNCCCCCCLCPLLVSAAVRCSLRCCSHTHTHGILASQHVTQKTTKTKVTFLRRRSSWAAATRQRDPCHTTPSTSNTTKRYSNWSHNFSPCKLELEILNSSRNYPF